MWLIFTLATTLLWGAAELFYKRGSREEAKYDHLRGIRTAIHRLSILRWMRMHVYSCIMNLCCVCIHRFIGDRADYLMM